MQYLTYSEFLEFGGSTDVSETAFDNLEFEARAQVNHWTFDRLTRETELPEEVKRCMYWIIEKLLAQQSLLSASLPGIIDTGVEVKGGIMSQSNDGVSVSYNTVSATSIMNNLGSEIRKAVDSYLGNVRTSLGRKVTYRGIYPDE